MDRNTVAQCREAGYRGRPLTGAWIETNTSATATRRSASSPPHGGVDRNDRPVGDPPQEVGSPPHGGVDRNDRIRSTVSRIARSPPHGGVDRNTAAQCREAGYRGSPPHGGVDRNSRTIWRVAKLRCRPLTGAWIETGPFEVDAWAGLVAPSRGRGSKLRIVCQQHLDAARRPLTGAWIETASSTGLMTYDAPSPPHGGVDRNAFAQVVSSVQSCRPLTGAWIETRARDRVDAGDDVAPSRGRGSKHEIHRVGLVRFATSPPHGGVDRNGSRRDPDLAAGRRPLTGAWIETTAPARRWRRRPRRPLTGAWIETPPFPPVSTVPLTVAPSRGRGSKQVSVALIVEDDPRRPLTGAWIETRRARPGGRRTSASPPHGGVDRNVAFGRRLAADHGVAPSRGRGSKHASTIGAVL